MLASLKSTLVVAGGTFLEAARNRLLHVSLLFTVALVAMSVAAASVSLFERARLIVDVGLAAASGVGSVIAIALTITSFARELSRRTAYPVLVRPLPRWAFVLGKYLGVLLTMELLVTLMLLATVVVVVIFGDWVSPAFWACLWLGTLEMAVVCAIALLFSTMAPPVLAAAYSAGVLIAGSLSQDLFRLAASLDDDSPGLAAVVRGIYYLLPDLASFSARTQAANRLPVAAGFVAWSTLYGVAYAAVLFVLTAWVFGRRRVI